MNHAIPALAAVLALAVSAAASASGSHGKNEQIEKPVLFWGAGADFDGADFGWFEDSSNDVLFTWDGYAWVGGDDLKFRLEVEGEALGGDVESSEIRALLSWNVAAFWDLQTGVRYDTEPKGLAWATLGVQGLAPYFFETDARLFVSEDGDAAFRLEQTFDVLLTQRLILQPHIEANVYAQDIPALGVGAGLSDIEAGLQLRYEFSRKFAPYVDIVYSRDLGETAQITRTAGADPEAATIRFGFRIRL